MSQNPDVQIPIGSAPSITTCSNCHSPMPGELRFCRNCGFRLGEGVAEYTETVRFDSARAGLVASGAALPVKKKKKMSGMTWIFIALVVFFVGAAALTAVITPFRRNVRTVGIVKPEVKSFVGVNGFDTADNVPGVTFDSVDAPGAPADKAGLVGGDIITKWDGKTVVDEGQMAELLVATPIGKTVEVEYLRDGQAKTTKLTTISEQEFRGLVSAFEKRPEGMGFFGFDPGDAERVAIPGTNLFGVKLNDVHQSRPADLAGIKDGDIVIEFDKTPIRTREEFGKRVRRALPYSTVDVKVMRAGEEGKPYEELTIPVKMGKQ